MEISILISSSLILGVTGFLIRWIFADMNKKFDLLFKKIEDLAKISDVEKLESAMSKEVDKRDARFDKMEIEIRQITDRLNRCKSCNA